MWDTRQGTFLPMLGVRIPVFGLSEACSLGLDIMGKTKAGIFVSVADSQHIDHAPLIEIPSRRFKVLQNNAETMPPCPNPYASRPFSF